MNNNNSNNRKTSQDTAAQAGSKYSRYFTAIKPILKNKYARNYSYMIFSVLTSIFFAVFAIQPTVTTIISLQKSIDEQQKILDQLNNKIETLSQAKKNYQAINPETRENLITMVPTVPDLPLLINNLDSLAIQNQATISGIQVQPTELVVKSDNLLKTATLNTIDLTVNSQSSYTQLKSLLEGISGFNRLVNITNFTFNLLPEQPLTVSITAKAYYIKN
jgi:hypothetical protein